MENKPVYIYGLICPEKQCVRYVGKSIKLSSRFRAHMSSYEYNHTTRLHRRNWIKGLIEKGLIPVLTILEKTNNEFWGSREIYWINKLRKDGHDLTNIAVGGKGGSGHTGCTHTDKAKHKMSLAKKGCTPWMKGKHHSKESLIQISKKLKGKPGPNLGKKMSREQRIKISVSNKGKNKGAVFSDAHKLKISQAAKERFQKRLKTALHK